MSKYIQNNCNSMGNGYIRGPLYDNRIWTIEDVALFTGYAVKTLYNKTSRREIPFKKRGSKLFFVPSEILNWIYEGDHD